MPDGQPLEAALKANGIAEVQKHKLLALSEVSLWLDTYDDIFSDFDPRPYSERAMSDDFLAESKKAVREKESGTIDLKFLIPAAKRDSKLEDVIKKRLHEHFRKQYHRLKDETRSIKTTGSLMMSLGMVMMVAATYMRSIQIEGFLYYLALVFLEPGGWFTTWYGLDHIFYHAGEMKPELDFYQKMSHCEIHFLVY
jgi:hypothetical protein